MHYFATAFLLSIQILTTSTSPLKATSECSKPPFFLLAGDSTTAIQSSDGGGWGNGFLNKTLKPPASGINYGVNGATTVSFRAQGHWDIILSQIKKRKEKNEVFVTIQFGHNDQKPASNISLSQYSSNLARFVSEVQEAGGEPILVTPLTRRNFDNSTSPPKIIESLKNERNATIAVAEETGSKWIDLNRESERYCNAIGPEQSWKYDLVEGDHTHLNNCGSVVFGRLVSDLLVKKYGGVFEAWMVANGRSRANSIIVNCSNVPVHSLWRKCFARCRY